MISLAQKSSHVNHPHYAAMSLAELERLKDAEIGLSNAIFDNADMIADADRLAVGQIVEESARRESEIEQTIEDKIHYLNKTRSPFSQESATPWLPLSEVMEAFGRGETGDAELLAQLFTDHIVYDHGERAWYLWNGQHWEIDCKNSIGLRVTNQVASQFLFAAAQKRRAEGEDSKAIIKELHARAGVLRYRNRIGNVLALATSRPTLALDGSEWDRDPFLFGVANGTLDLRTGELRPGQPKDYIRKCSPIEWQGLNAAAPRWGKFLSEIFADDDELIGFLQRWFGYCLTGDTREDSFVVLHGEDGRNGKRLLSETIKRVMGAYGLIGDDDILLAGRDRSAGSPKQFLVDLKGGRLVLLSETQEGSRFHLARIKALTGSDAINAREVYGTRGQEIGPTWKIILGTNRMPTADSDDSAFFERICVVPFTQRFITEPDRDKANEHLADKTLEAKLAAEAPGVLAWLLRGCLDWQTMGLNPPRSVKLATRKYRESEDVIAQFIAEKCVVKPEAQVKGGEIYAAFSTWGKESGLMHMSGVEFGKRLAKRFTKLVGSHVIYHGIGLLENDARAIDAPPLVVSDKFFDLQEAMALAALTRNKK